MSWVKNNYVLIMFVARFFVNKHVFFCELYKTTVQYITNINFITHSSLRKKNSKCNNVSDTTRRIFLYTQIFVKNKVRLQVSHNFQKRNFNKSINTTINTTK